MCVGLLALGFFVCFGFDISSSGIVLQRYNFPISYCFHGLHVETQQQTTVSHQALRDGFSVVCFAGEQVGCCLFFLLFTCLPAPWSWKYLKMGQCYPGLDQWGAAVVRKCLESIDLCPLLLISCLLPQKRIIPSQHSCLQVFFCVGEKNAKGNSWTIWPCLEKGR